uniref:Uncharacterized protein n=1 Tax=Mesocestoides corti TaxID=53468 RepID=A0A5K3F7P8_MESCO
MASEVDIEKLEISKNLLQMNFMKRTLIAKEKLATPKKLDDLPTEEDFQFTLPKSVRESLSQRLAVVSKNPVVRHVPGRTINTNVGLRVSYGGFNPYLSGASVEPTTPIETKEPQVRAKYSGRKLISGHKRKHEGERPHKSSKKSARRSLL